MQSPKTICCLFFKICVNLKDKQYTLPRKKKVSFGKENYHSNHPTFVKLKANRQWIPYKTDGSWEGEEENDEDKDLEGEALPLKWDKVMPPPP